MVTIYLRLLIFLKFFLEFNNYNYYMLILNWRDISYQYRQVVWPLYWKLPPRIEAKRILCISMY